jgi:hypothetical protein
MEDKGLSLQSITCPFLLLINLGAIMITFNETFKEDAIVI